MIFRPLGSSILALVLAGSTALAMGQTRPKALRSPPPDYPPAAEQAGHQGTVSIQLTILADGSTSEISLAQSSHSKELDEAALTAVEKWKFSPATDAEGKPISIKATVPLKFEKANSVDFTQKPCKEFVVETKWFQQAFPELKLSDMVLYKRTLGFLVISSTDKLALVRKYEGAYAKSLAECEAKPDTKFWAILSANAR